MKVNERKSLTLKTLNKSNVWDLQENDIFRLIESASRDSDAKENFPHYLDIIKSAFEVEDITIDKPEVIKKYEARGFKIGTRRQEDGEKLKIGIKKRPILRVTDLTYENIHHITAAKLIEVLDRNFGGGWDSLSQSIQDIIQSGFDISTTTLPKDRLHKKGGMYDKKVSNGYDVLEIPKGEWIEAIFAKVKPENEKLHLKVISEDDSEFEHENEEDAFEDINDNFEDNPNDEELLEDSYRTTIEENSEDLDITADDIAAEEDYQ